MRFYISFIFFIFIFLWLIAIALFSGLISNEWLPEALLRLKLPDGFDEVGGAMSTLDGLFSSIAIVLGLIAILFQGRELKASTEAQALQAQALTQQIAQQEAANLLGAYSARLSYLSAEIELMENNINSMVEQAKNPTPSMSNDKVTELWEIIKRTRNKQQRYRQETVEIDNRIQKLLTQLNKTSSVDAGNSP